MSSALVGVALEVPEYSWDGSKGCSVRAIPHPQALAQKHMYSVTAPGSSQSPVRGFPINTHRYPLGFYLGFPVDVRGHSILVMAPEVLLSRGQSGTGR